MASASSAVREVLGVDDKQFATGAVAADSPRLFADAVQAVLALPLAERREATRRRAEQFPWSNTIDSMLSLHQSSHERRAA
jgi:alpha-1,6-mannosyltransferase